MIDFNNREEVINKLQELKDKKLPHMTIEQFSIIDKSFAKEIEKATDIEKEEISKQLYPFYRAKNDNICIFTDELPSLTWGLTHGVAQDSKSGLSWRCYHYFTINSKKDRYEVTLQYHSDNYEIE